MSQPNSYAPFDVATTLAVPEAFQAHDLLAWSDRLSVLGICQASAGLTLELASMSRASLDPRQRLLLLHLLEDPLQAILRGLFGRAPDSSRANDGQRFDLNMRDRLACAYFRNLKQARGELRLDPWRPDADLTETLVWALQQQFDLLGRQIESSLAARREPPHGTWLELHGCFADIWERVHPVLDGGGAARYADDCQAEAAYKRLILMGFIAANNAALVLEPGFGSRLRTWVAETRLVVARSVAGGYDLWMVDLAADEPGRWIHEPIAQGSGGWVLIPSKVVGDYVQAATQIPFPGKGRTAKAPGQSGSSMLRPASSHGVRSCVEWARLCGPARRSLHWDSPSQARFGLGRSAVRLWRSVQDPVPFRQSR